MGISSGIAEVLLISRTSGHWQAPVMVGDLIHLLSDQVVVWADTWQGQGGSGDYNILSVQCSISSDTSTHGIKRQCDGGDLVDPRFQSCFA